MTSHGRLGRRGRVLASLGIIGGVIVGSLAAGAPAYAHGVLIESNPAEGAGLEVSPTAIELTFSEEPEASLATISLVGPEGDTIALGDVSPAIGDPLTLAARVPTLEEGVYTIAWRIVSRVDGHATAGAFAFGIGITPDQADLANAARSAEAPPASTVELVARWFYLGGMMLLFGATCAVAAGFGSTRRAGVVATFALVPAVVGASLLAIAQRSSAAATFGEYLDTYPGKAMVGRVAVLVVAGALVAIARHTSPPASSSALGAGALVAAVGIAVHVAAGHAAAAADVGRWIAMTSQWAHFVAAGLWIGGLATLLFEIRGRPGPSASHNVRRFSQAAAIALAVVVATGVVRSVQALTGWDDLTSTGYGRSVAAKLALVACLAALGLVNRLRSVHVAQDDLRPLRRTSTGELAVASVAILAAAVLGVTSPPFDVEPLGIRVDGSDSTGTLSAHLETNRTAPGPNRFEVELEEVATGEPAAVDRVTLRFRPLDDPGVPTTTVELAAEPDRPGVYAGSGANLAFEGRWEVSIVAEQAAASRSIPLEVRSIGPPPFRSIAITPGEPTQYLAQLSDNRWITITPEPSSTGEDRVQIEFLGFAFDPVPIDRVVVTSTSDGVTEQLPVDRVDGWVFSARTDLGAGDPEITVIGRDGSDRRMYATFDIDVDGS